MKGLVDISTWRGRCFLLACILVLPFLRFLLQNRYGLLRIEVAAAVAVLAVTCSVLAALTRVRAIWYPAVLCCMVLTATLPATRLMDPAATLNPVVVALLLAVALGAAAWLMRDNFMVIMAVFALSSVSVDVVLHAIRSMSTGSRPARAWNRSRPPSHVLYLVLDEQMGLAGLPEWIPECCQAKRAIQATLERGGFRIYPFAYSNYPSTISSLPSLLNRRLLQHRRNTETSQQWGTWSLRQNRLMMQHARRGYRIAVYQHSAIDYTAGGVGVSDLHEYTDVLGQLDQAPGPWMIRFRWIVGNYQHSDPVLARVKAFFPFRFTPHTTGPLALGRYWASQLGADIAAARSKTLFFAHLMIPHFPYLYRRDGSIRDLREWSSDRVDQRSDAYQYLDRYRRYCEQAEHVSRELDRLFSGLRASGVYDSSLVVLHGDHGSRIRRYIRGSAGDADDLLAAGSDPEVYDYSGAPPVSDLLDRFSSLLAVKFPGSRSTHTDTRTASLLRLLSEVLPLEDKTEMGPAADLAYLFDAEGAPRGIPIVSFQR